VNTPSRWGTQAPFSNITLDWKIPNDLAELPCIVGGREMDYCYKDCQKEMDMINKAFIEVMIEGDANGRGFQYPIPTYSITKDFDWSDTETTASCLRWQPSTARPISQTISTAIWSLRCAQHVLQAEA
jgi:ribonucleoside-triphosphate reductase